MILLTDKSVMGFLEVLDRRRYEVDLKVAEEPMVYRAASRAEARGEG